MFESTKVPSFIAVAQAHGDDMHEDEAMHKMDNHSPEQSDQGGIPFRVTFPAAGLYKAFAQFRPLGSTLPPDQAMVASFWLKVQESGSAALPPAGPAPRTLLVVFSLIGIVVVSWGVRKYLAVRV